MIEITNYTTPSPNDWAFAIQGMRNPLDSWSKSDSVIIYTEDYNEYHIENISDRPDDFISIRYLNEYIKDKTPIENEIETYNFCLGEADKKLLLQLCKNGSEHRKVLRQLKVGLRITAPLKWWDQMDQYKSATVTNSTSQMHTVTKEIFALEDFSVDGLVDEEVPLYDIFGVTDSYSLPTPLQAMETLIAYLNNLIRAYNHTKDRKYWDAIIRLVPQSFNYTRNWTGSMENLVTIYFQRFNHKLPEWRAFCKWLLDNIPMFREIIEAIKGNEI